ncbi:MAG: hypothetical protein OEM01_04790, partial [Desulfobulbaceae bacterium]|nr:hypothetical protein [Desulfobulbaceae bacterium]
VAKRPCLHTIAPRFPFMAAGRVFTDLSDRYLLLPARWEYRDKTFIGAFDMALVSLETVTPAQDDPSMGQGSMHPASSSNELPV